MFLLTFDEKKKADENRAIAQKFSFEKTVGKHQQKFLRTGKNNITHNEMMMMFSSSSSSSSPRRVLLLRPSCRGGGEKTRNENSPFRGGGKGGKGARRTPTTTTRTRRLLTSAAASSKESSSSPSEKKTKTSKSSSDTITNTNTTTNTKKKKGEKERQQKIKEYWKDRRKVACQENDPMCLDIMRTPMKSFDEMEEEERELNALAPEFMDGDVIFGKVNDVPSFPVFKGEILNAPEETLNVVEFTFSWCRPCKKFAAKYDMFAEYYDKVRFFKVVGDSDPVLATTAKSMNVTSTPHFFLFRGGKMVGSFTGTNEDNFREELGFAMKDEEKP
jgi:thiol-disulfide isomerase/thioredoxin